MNNYVEALSEDFEPKSIYFDAMAAGQNNSLGKNFLFGTWRHKNCNFSQRNFTITKTAQNRVWEADKGKY